MILKNQEKFATIEREEKVTEGFEDLDQKHASLIWDEPRGREIEFIFIPIENLKFLTIFSKIVDLDLVSLMIANTHENLFVLSKNIIGY